MTTVDDERLRRDRILLIEYQKAQDSAEHHDKLLWSAVGLIATGMASVLFFAASHPAVHRASKTRLIFPGIGVVLSCLLNFFVKSFAKFRNQKYELCKIIEHELGMSQHRGSRSGGQQLLVSCVSCLCGVSFFLWLAWLVWLLYTQHSL